MSAIDLRVTSSTDLPILSDELSAELDRVNAEFESVDPLTILKWTFERFGDRAVVASSFQDAVLADLVSRAKADARIIFLDTGFHFSETLAYLHHVKKKLNLNLEITQPTVDMDTWPCGSARCCEFRKVEPLRRALVGAEAWVTGLKRADTPERADAPIVAFDPGRGIVKVNPIANWTEDDVEAYVVERGLPRHPLNYVGYLSIGCEPTTRPVAEGEDPRAGRWADSDKTECGLHI